MPADKYRLALVDSPQPWTASSTGFPHETEIESLSSVETDVFLDGSIGRRIGGPATSSGSDNDLMLHQGQGPVDRVDKEFAKLP